MIVSIIIPVYNGRSTIKRAVDSALSQKFPKNAFEVIVVNDGSTDRTLEILKSYGKRIKIINQKNQGAIKAANRGFKMAKGKYVIKLDADDAFEPDILKEMVAVLDRAQNIDFVYSDYYEKRPDGKVKIVSTRNNLFNTIAIGVMFRKKSLAEEGFYDEKMIFAEYDLLLKTQGRWKGYYIGKPLFWYIRRPESLTGSEKLLEKAFKELEKKYPEKIREIKKIRKY